MKSAKNHASTNRNTPSGSGRQPLKENNRPGKRAMDNNTARSTKPRQTGKQTTEISQKSERPQRELPKKNLAAPNEQEQEFTHGEKLHKILSRSGVASRRTVEQMIQEKRVSVNGVVSKLGDRLADLSAQVRVDGRPVRLISTQQSVCRVLAYNKDEGEICSRTDPEGRRTIFDRLPHLKDARWVAVGRLDINTSGLILLTTDGELANQLMHPSHQVEREYSVRIYGEVTEAMVKNLVSGVTLEDGVARFEDVVYAGGEGNHHNFYVMITEGRNREVRRLWESQGVMVSRLKRVRYGNIILDKMLPKGGWQELPLEDVNYLRDLTSLRHERTTLISPRERDANPRSKKHRITRAVRRHTERSDPKSSEKRRPAKATERRRFTGDK